MSTNDDKYTMTLITDIHAKAKRIEQLEAVLREIIMCWRYEECAELARTALGEKKDD